MSAPTTGDDLAVLSLNTIDKPWTNPAGRLVISADATREAWLAARRYLIGASDVAKLLGVSKYGSAFTVWADKTGQTPDDPTSAAARRGQLFEDAIVQLWAERYADFPIRTRRQGLVVSKAFPHVGATVDRLSVCLLDGRPSRCVVEVKSNAQLGDWDDNEVPADYQLQGLTQLLVTGRDHVHFVVMGPRFVPMHRVIYRDEPAIQLIGETVERFWADHVDTGVAPTPAGDELAVLGRVLHAAAPDKQHVIDTELAPHVDALVEARRVVADAQRAANDAEARVKAAMGDAEELVWPDGTVAATWKAGKTIDGANAEWRRANPELVARYGRPAAGVDLDVAALVAAEPQLVESGQLRRRRTFSVKGVS